MVDGNKLISKILLQRKNKRRISPLNLQKVKEYNDKVNFKTKEVNFKSFNQKKIIKPQNIFDLECQKYYDLMEKYNFSDQAKMNNYLTREKEWDNFPSIRAINNHGNYTNIRGITPKAYAKVCELMKKNISSGGQPLTSSKQY